MVFASTMAAARSREETWSLGGTLDHFSAAKLPSRKKMRRILFDFHYTKRLNLKSSVKKVACLFLSVWSRGRISTRYQSHVITHVKK